MTRTIDIFCGAGGLSEGFREAGFDLRLGLDIWKHACDTHQANFSDGATWCSDVRDVTGKAVMDAVGGPVDVVIGGPNCQGVSERGMRDPDDIRNSMFPEFARLIAELKPRAFVMENVAGLTHRHNWPLLRSIFRTLTGLGYRCAGDVVRAADYGVPQLRHRFLLIGVRGGSGSVLFPKPIHTNERAYAHVEGGLLPHVTLRDAIADLPAVASGGGAAVAAYRGRAKSAYQKVMREGANALFNHIASDIADINLQRISYVPEGGNWKDIPPSLLPPRFLDCRMTDHSTTYARLRWDHPAFTLTALFGNVTAGAFTHPSQNRALTVREGARIHGFPDRFKFDGPLNSQYRQIGNAVPPRLARVFAEHLATFLGNGAFPNDSVVPRLPDSFVARASWDDVPVLAPRYRDLFGTGTRWPQGWGPEPTDRRSALTDNYRLKVIPETAAAA